MPLDDMTELRKRVPGGKYALARAVAARARQLQEGEPPLVRVESPNPLSVAISEILEGKISFHIEDNAVNGVVGEPKAAADLPGGSFSGGEVVAPDVLDETMATSSRNAPDPARDEDAPPFSVQDSVAP